MKRRSPAALFSEPQRTNTPSTIPVLWRFAKLPENASWKAWEVSVKHTTGTWATCSRPGPGILVQDLGSGRETRCVHARTFRLACISEICHSFLRNLLPYSLPAMTFSSQPPSPISAASLLHHHQCLTFSPHRPYFSHLTFPTTD